jgi:type II secretory pathway pseudopilin PulG
MPSTRSFLRGMRPRRRRQSGLSLLQVMLLLVLLSAVVAAAFQTLQSGRDGDNALSQEQALAWADNAVAAFASAHSRLPCPAATVDGAEDCAIGAKGYLPTLTLATAAGMEASLIGASGPGQLPGPVLYAVNRGADADTDLAAAQERYAPLDNDGNARTTFTRKDGSEFAYDAVNGLDFCRALVAASEAPATDATAHTRDHAGGTLNIAYGVAVAGPTPGESGRFDRENDGDAVAFNGPWTLSDSSYDDRVRVRSFQALAESSGCRVLASTIPPDPTPLAPDSVPLAAVDLAGEAVNIADTVSDLQESTLESAEDSVESGEMAVAFGAIGITLTGVKIGTTTIDLVEKIGLLTQNIVRCAVSLGVECWRVPLSVASLATVGAALAQAVVALGLQSGALADTKDALEKARKAKDMAKSETEKDPADLAAAIRQAYVTAWGDGNCDGNGDPVAPATTCEIGLLKRADNLEAEAVTAEEELDTHHSHYIAPWEDSQITDRIAGYNDLSDADKVSERNSARNFRRLAQEAVDIQLQIEAKQALLTEYDERLDQLQQMTDRTCTDPDTCYRVKVEALCAKTDSVSALRCNRARQELVYVETCERNGIYDPGTASSDEVPMCIPAVSAGKPPILAEIDALEDQRDARRLAVRTSGMLDFASRTWVDEVKDKDGNVTTPGYYRYTYPNRLRYPSNWFCEGGTCSVPFSSVWDWWGASGDGRLPLLRAGTFLDCSKTDFYTKMHCTMEWMSYGDAWREYRLLLQVATKARDLADKARNQYLAAKANYEQLVDLATRHGNGEPVELWLGAHEILKGIDDRGALGPDRNGAAASTVMP